MCSCSRGLPRNSTPHSAPSDGIRPARSAPVDLFVEWSSWSGGGRVTSASWGASRPIQLECPEMNVKTIRPELVEKLAEGIGNLTTSDQWRRYLEFQSRFHRYSYGNVLLIAAQCPEATQVAGFNAWRKVNRFVRQGEKAIYILAPMVDKNTEAANGEDRPVIRGFKFVPVFDVAQTDGAELPSICTRLDGEDPAGRYAQLSSVARSLGFCVVDHEFDGATNGDCCHAEYRIRIEVRNTPTQRVKTLAHEIGHALLHERFESRAVAELEAESIAYIVCQCLGFDTGDYSFGYVATWAGGGERAISGIKASCERIQKAATTIVASCELGQGEPGEGETAA